MLLVLIYAFLIREEERDPIIITAYSSYELLSLDDLIAESDLIVVGKLDSVYPSRWNTPNGRLPRGTTVYSITSDKMIFTDVNINLTQIIKGEKNQNVVRIRSLGGVVEQDQMIADDVIPEFGKNYLLFLSQEIRPTENFDPIHYWTFGYQGIYEITDGKAVSVKDEWILEDLIAYIQESLSTEIPSLTLSPVPTELLIETLTPFLAPTETPLLAVTPTELLTETPTELPTQTPTPTETVSPTP